MSYRTFLLSAVFVGASAMMAACAQTTSAPSSTVERTEQAAVTKALPTDPALHTGVLDNGLRYIFQKNETPEQTAAMRLYIDAGSLEEEADQSGLAHFVEHMAFNGSKNVPEGEMLKLLERTGLAFGADTNAATSYDYTLYMLDLPSVTEEVIDTGLFIMRETAGNLTFTPEAVERERGVVQAEKRRATTALEANREDSLAHLLPDMLAKDRPVLGTDEVLANAPRERFVDFYEQYYRPDNAVLIIVGDIDIKTLEAKVESTFSDWTARSETLSQVYYGLVTPNTEIRASYFSEPTLPTIIEISSAVPVIDAPETIETRQEEMINLIVSGILNRRLSARTLEESPVILQGVTFTQKLFNTAEIASLNLVSNPENWQAALQLGEQEIRRAFLHGFSQSEIDEQMANLSAQLKNAAQQAASRPNPNLATTIALELKDNRAITSPAQDLAMFEDLRAQVTGDVLLNAFRKAWGRSAPTIHVANAETLENAEDIILATYTESQQVTVAPPENAGAAVFAYTDFGPAGAIAKDTRIEDLNTRSIRFDNNVKLNIKKTDFEDGVVHASLRVGTGLLEMPRDVDGLATISGFFFAGGLEKHSLNELQSLMAGRTVQPNFALNETAFASAARTTPDDLLFQLQLWAAYITEPGYRPEGEALWNQQAVLLDQIFGAEPLRELQRKAPRLLRNGDLRFGIGESGELQKRNFAELSVALERSLKEGVIEITLVGDVDEDAAIAAVADTFGALPERRSTRLVTAEGLNVSFTEDKSLRTLNHTGSADRAVSALYWHTADASDLQTEATMTLLANVLRLKITERVREELGAAYTSVAQSNMSPVFTDFGTLLAVAEVETESADQIIDVMESLGASLSSQGGITEDELLRARQPLLELLEAERAGNTYWLSELSSMQENPDRLTKTRGLKEAYGAVTVSDLQAAAATYLADEAPVRIRVLPSKTEQ